LNQSTDESILDKSRNKRGFVLKSASHVANSRNAGQKSLNKSYALPPLGH